MTLKRIAVLCSAALLAACGTFTDRKDMDYRSASGGAKIATLEVPPDLTSPSAEDRFVIPVNKGSTTFSSYNRERGAQPVARDAGVLPKVDNAGIVRAGDQRWLVVFGTPDKVWPLVREFWAETGFVLKREHPELGIMETDWAENRARIPMDPVRRTIGRVFDGMYSTSERDKFRTRIELGSQPGTVEIFVSHRGMEEVYASEYKDQTIWQPRKADRELEAEMLNRLLVKFGFDDKKPGTNVAAAAPAQPSTASYDAASGGPLRVNEPFDRAWRRVGLALDRVGFTVEDRDRAKGLYFVRYIDPEADNNTAGGKGFLSKLAFWRKDAPDDQKPQYRILVSDAGGAANVNVQNAKGEPETSPTGKRIMGLLYDQLK